MPEPQISGDDHWLVRPQTITRLWKLFAAILTLTVLADLFVHHHSSFLVDGSFGFGAWFGFGACVALVLLAKGVGIVLKRPDDYYGE